MSETENDYPTIVDTVTYSSSGETAHIHKWSNGIYTQGMLNNENDDPRNIAARLNNPDVKRVQEHLSKKFSKLKPKPTTAS